MGSSIRSVMRRLIGVLCIAAVVGIRPGIAAADLSSVRKFDIPAQPVPSALLKFSAQSGVQVTSSGEALEGKDSPGVVGMFDARAALARLLKGTGLRYDVIDPNTIAIRSESHAGAGPAGQVPPPGAAPTEPSHGKEGKTSSSAGFRVARVDQTTPGSTASLERQNHAPPQAVAELQEVVVTAEKREERLLDTPVPVTAISGASLAQSNQVRIQDYALTVPGFSVSGQSGFYQNLSIRGITTGTANPTVGIMIDDVPFGSSSIDGGGLFVPDFDPGDLARVEVLRGPQGTLYGASSMGGLLKFVTIDPSLAGYSGHLTAGTSSIYNGAALGYNARGSLNVPLTDTWAVRLSGFAREDPGFIDDPVLHREGVNKTSAYGGRLSALWRPSQNFSLKLSALYQDVKIGGDNNATVAPGFGTYGVTVPPDLAAYDQIEVPGAGSSDMKIQVYSATARAHFGSADLTVISGYTVNSSQFSQDYSALIPSEVQFSVAGTRLDLDMRNGKFTQEIRLAMPLGTVVDWLLGGFYSHESTSYGQILNAVDSTSGQIAGQWVYFSVPQTYAEYSGFTDFTFHVTERLDIQLGARDSQIKQTSSETQVGAPYAALIGSANPIVYPPVDSNVNAFTYLLTPRWKFSADWMAYARLASGYRPGGPNVAPGVPPQYQPDKTQNYELGLKGAALEHSITLDASLYYIDWKNIQLTLLDPQNYQGYTANASRAKSQGLELSVSATPVTGLTTAAWAAWNTAALKEGFPYSGMLYEAFGAPGDRLPFGSRFSGNVSVNDEFRLWAGVSANVGIIESYVGNQVGGFQNVTTPGTIPSRQYYPPYARMDLRAGLSFDTWNVNFFVNNVANRFAITPLGGVDASPLPSNYFTVLQPRLIGLNLTKTF